MFNVSHMFNVSRRGLTALLLIAIAQYVVGMAHRHRLARSYEMGWRTGRASRRDQEPPSDAEIERGLRERAVSDPRAAEILLRWLQRPRAEERVGGVDLDSMSERELKRVYAGLLKLAALPDEELRALIGSLLADTEDD